MLPALPGGRPRLTDVLASSLAAVRGLPNPLRLPAVRAGIVLVVDGLGADQLAARSGHARTLAAAMGRPASRAWTVFPSTTASALASLTTGVGPGRHGLIGYTALDRANDRVVNELTGWDDRMTPATWQLAPTLFERAVEGDDGAAVACAAIGEARFEGSGFTHAVLRGAEYRGAATLAERLASAREFAAAHPRSLCYVYTADVDKAGHGHGWQSPEWTRALEEVEDAVRDVAPALRRDEGMLITADHGMVDATDHILIDEPPGLLDGVRHVAGEARCLQLQLEPGVDAAGVAGRWRASQADRAYVGTRDEVLRAGWIDDVDPRALDRMGDVVVVARGRTAYYDGRTASSRSREMVGQHGGVSPAELSIPLLRFGAFAD